MADWETLAGGLATTLESAIPQLRTYPVVPDSVAVGWAVALIGTPEGDGSVQVEYDVGPIGCDLWHFKVRLISGKGDVVSAKKKLMAFASRGNTNSIYDAVNDNITLGVGAAKSIVWRAIDLGPLQLADGAEYEVIDFDIGVWAY